MAWDRDRSRGDGWSRWQDWSEDWSQDWSQDRVTEPIHHAKPPPPLPWSPHHQPAVAAPIQPAVAEPIQPALAASFNQPYPTEHALAAPIHPAAAEPIQPAVADECFTMEYFRNFQPWSCRYPMHNAALKWFRQCGEQGGLDRKVFHNTQPEMVAQLIHPKGMEFKFSEDPTQDWPWHWQEMIAQLNDASMRHVVEGGIHPTAVAE